MQLWFVFTQPVSHPGCQWHVRFEPFWEKCRRVLHNEQGSAAHERRHINGSSTREVLYASRVTSVENLIKQATDLLQADVDSGKLVNMPPVPSNQTVRLQFVPNNDTANTAARMTGKLGVVRQVQTRTLRNQHPDQHYVNAMTRSHLEWLVALQDTVKNVTASQGLPSSSLARTTRLRYQLGNMFQLQPMQRQPTRTLFQQIHLVPTPRMLPTTTGSVPTSSLL
jgi:hypothetical protein